uniref:Uncharacterized protein n=1 Tax=Cannabis sativa TaxID=3483 RepID=A0A803R0A3_CANSA
MTGSTHPSKRTVKASMNRPSWSRATPAAPNFPSFAKIAPSTFTLIFPITGFTQCSKSMFEPEGTNKDPILLC